MNDAQPTVEDRIAERNAQKETLRAALAEVGLDGPFEVRSGDVFGGILSDPFVYAICTRCGSIVRLNDPTEETRVDGQPVERGVLLHTRWHEALAT